MLGPSKGNIYIQVFICNHSSGISDTLKYTCIVAMAKGFRTILSVLRLCLHCLIHSHLTCPFTQEKKVETEATSFSNQPKRSSLFRAN